MNQKKLIRVLVLLLAISALLCGTAVAFMFQQTATYQNQFEAARVDCLVHEKMDGSGNYTDGSVYGETKTSITVENTGTIEAYIRLHFVSYWVDVNNKIIGKPAQVPEITINGDWIKGNDNNYYCKAPVKSGEFTGELLAAPIELQKDLDHGYYQVLEVFADAIQSLPAKAVESSWNVTVDGDRNITLAENTQ